MKIVFMGTPDFAAVTLTALLDAGHEVAAVVTQEDKPVGRKQVLTPSAVKKAAAARGIAVLQPARVRGNKAFFTQLTEIAPDVIVVAAYGQIIPQEILDLPRYGCLNVHASLLPAYRGAAPIQWAVINGEKEAGVTIMQMNAGLDTGDMLAKVALPLSPDETGGSLFDRLAEAGAALLVETLDKVAAGDVHPVRQPAESTTAYARMLTKADGEVDWQKSAVSIERLVRGLNPWPAAWTTLHGQTCKIWRARVCAEGERADRGEEARKAQPCGAVLSACGRLLVQTGDGVLELCELQPAGKKRMSAADFLRGHQALAGAVLGA